MPLHVMGEMQTDSKHHQHFWVPVGNCLEFRIRQNKQARLSLFTWQGCILSSFSLFFFFLKGHPSKIPKRGEAGISPCLLGLFL